MSKLKLIKIFLLMIISSLNVHAQISPGDLTSFHSNLEGLSNCTKCHELGKQVFSSKCLDCHREIKTLISKNKGYHSSQDVKSKECWSCHSEHHGRNFRIINFSKENFNHSKAGFILTGSHQKIKCEDCHQPKFISDSKLRKRKNTYLGLSTDCLSCHEDYHQGNLGNNCENCHNTEKFSEVSKFDHDKTNFKLTGEHNNVECSKCHPVEVKNGIKQTKFKGLFFSNCSPCHNDVHKGSLGKDCKSCHITKSFKIMNQSTFDHSKTKFPLIGKHQSVRCNDCHKGSVINKPQFDRCYNCHQDFHKGEFIKNNTLTDCNSCHDEKGFSPSLFTIERHNQLRFQLDGAHLAIPCIGCHKKDEELMFRIASFDCQNCHQNVHGNELTEKYLPGNNCQSCHKTSSWRTITFDHSGTNFDLSGKHKNVDCRDCHYKIGLDNKRRFKFLSIKNDCIECHKDVHFSQFDVNGKTDCYRCHTFENWKAEKFDHNKTRFSLEGAHGKLKCLQCHLSVTINGNTFIKFKLDDFKCASCHSQRL